MAGGKAKRPDDVKAALPDKHAPVAQLVHMTKEPAKLGAQNAVGHIDGDELVLSSPDVRLNAEVEIINEASDDQIDGIIEAGPIQDMLHSERIGVYKRPDGTHFETRLIQDRMFDAQYRANTPAGEKKQPDYGVRRWYQRPVNLGPMNRSAKPSFFDAPGFPAPLKKDGGVLEETKGSDKFVTSFAASRGEEEPVHLWKTEWEVPWATKVDPAKRDYVLGSVQPKPTNETPKMPRGDLPINGTEWVGYATQADAMAAPISQLINALPLARGKDAQSYQFIKAALTAKNPTVTITLRCTNTYHWWGKDKVNMVMMTGTATKGDGFDLNTNDQTSRVYALTDLISLDAWDGSDLRIKIHAHDKDLDEYKVKAPFDGATAMKAVPGSDGRYLIGVSRSA